MKILVLLSGGLDSIAALTKAVEYYPDATFTVVHSQRQNNMHPRWIGELYAVIEIIKYFKEQSTNISLDTSLTIFPMERTYRSNSIIVNIHGLIHGINKDYKNFIVGDQGTDFESNNAEPLEFGNYDYGTIDSRILETCI